MVMIRRQELAAEPCEMVPVIWLPRLPVCRAVSAKAKLGAVTPKAMEAAVSVPLLTRTQRKLEAPCWTAEAMAVPMSYLRATTGPKAVA